MRAFECCRSRSAKCAVSDEPLPRPPSGVRPRTKPNRRYIMATAKKPVKAAAKKPAAKKPAAKKPAAKKPAAKKPAAKKK